MNSVARLTQQVGRCAFVGVFEEQLTQVNNRLTSLEAEVGKNTEKLSNIKQKTQTSFNAVQDTLGDLEAEQQKVRKGLKTLRSETAQLRSETAQLRSETAQLALTVGRNITQIKEELSDVKQNADTNFAAVGVNLATIKGELVGIKQRTNTGFAAVQDTLGDLKAEQQKVGEGLETLRSETAQLKEELSDVKQNADTNFVAVGVNLATIKGELVGIKQRTNTSFTAVQDTLGDLETEQQKVGDGLETLRSETAQLTLTVGRNITLPPQYLPASCSEIAKRDPSSPPGYYQLSAPDGTITTDYCFAHNCSDIATSHPSSPPGYYQLRAPNGAITTEYCPMECKKCLAIKSTGGWRRVAYLNMTDPTHQCPSGFRLFTEPRRCSPGTSNSFTGCASVTYPVHGIQYQRVCGRVIAIHKGRTEAFLNSPYPVDGVSLTHGSPPTRHHIWTFAAARDEQTRKDRFRCPCSDTSQSFTGHVPAYVGNDYFCDSGTRVSTTSSEVYTEDPLWDGHGCGPTSSCCTFNSPPWFCKELPQPTTDDIELRLCRSGLHVDEDVQIKLIELYTQKA